MNTQTFLDGKTVFDLREFAEFYARERPGKTTVRSTLLKYYFRAGRVKHIRKGLYLSTPPGKQVVADPYLISSKMAVDAVLAYSTALQFHGKVHTVLNDYVCCSSFHVQPFEYEGNTFKALLYPRVLQTHGQEMSGVEEVQFRGDIVRVTSVERTMVDMLQRPERAGGWEEVWQSLEVQDRYRLDKVIEYVRVLRNATTAAKVGFFLDYHRELVVGDLSQLELLKVLRPKSPHYLERSQQNKGKFFNAWNLVVPDFILEKRWEK